MTDAGYNVSLARHGRRYTRGCGLPVLNEPLKIVLWPATFNRATAKSRVRSNGNSC